jgi:hypothetical protein
MERDTDLGWELIGHDPLLRLELSTIERQAESDEEIVTELMRFFARIDGMMKLGKVIFAEEAERG